ncbi:PREDICTED: uncharacterized protein LOC105969838 [Erythranthe guttata]|uniref:uncharacterized protein LOC105969838 n=1 Tax=Erythranthe guttata TaxID=4155 RepID=UPI00064DA945|nr:PREDICTED: uncharacterized protein LOC105969838 [Erythranthe guttata]|eukprot:XP_012850069.1 PREDICTED: uncharacterized protein LOC105969838 [Erythranthe guttata]
MARDGTYVDVRVSLLDKPRYRNQKGDISVNVLVVCDVNLNFVYVLTGWEGSVADSRVIRDAVTRANKLRVPKDYAVGTLAPQDYQEYFNMKHAKTRNVIERAFGILKSRTTNDYDPVEDLVPQFITTNENSPNCVEVIRNVESSQQLTDWRVMEGTSMSQRNSNLKGKSGITRRTWTLIEEQMLISALKDTVARGWKCENGFKTGYLATLEGAMSVSFPGTDLKAEPHIHSKIHNDSSSTIDVQDDEDWNDYMNTDPAARTMRYKAWPYYKDWLVIFGKDRATGEHAEVYVEAVNDLIGSSKGKEPTSVGGGNVSLGDASLDGDITSFVSTRGEGATIPKTTRKTKKKRACVDDVDLQLVDMMAKLFDKADQKLGRLVKRVGFNFDVSESRKKVFDALSSFEYLTGEDKLHVTKVLCETGKDMDIFFSVNDEHKELMVAMILQGRY